MGKLPCFVFQTYSLVSVRYKNSRKCMMGLQNDIGSFLGLIDASLRILCVMQNIKNAFNDIPLKFPLLKYKLTLLVNAAALN